MNSQNKDKLNSLIQQYRGISAPTDLSNKPYNNQPAHNLSARFSMPSLAAASSLLAVFLIIGIFMQPNLSEQSFDDYPDMGQLSSMNISMHNTISSKMPGLADLGQLPDLTSIHIKLKPQTENKIQPQHETHYFIHIFS